MNRFIIIVNLCLLTFSNLFASSLEQKRDSILTILSIEKQDSTRFSLHYQLVNYYWDVDYDSCLHHFEKAIELAKKSCSEDELIMTLINKGVFFNDYGYYDKALEVYSVTFDYITENTDPITLGRLYGNIGNSYSSKLFFSQAVDYYRKAINIFEREQNKPALGNLYGTLGNLYYRNGNYQDAIDYYKSGINVFQDLGVIPGVAVSTMNIGNSHKQLSNPDSAFYYYNKALHKFDSLGNMPYYKAQCLANLGNLNTEIGDFKQAESYLAQAKVLFSQMQNHFSLAMIAFDFARVFMQTNRLAKAKEEIDVLISLSKEHGFDNLLTSGYRQLWLYYDEIGSYKKAYDWLIFYINRKDSLDKITREGNVDLLLAQLETERKEREIEVLKKDQEISQLQIRRKTTNQYITLVGLVLAVALAIVLFFVSSQRRKKNNLLAAQNAEINQQKEEITSQRDEIESQRNILKDQNDALERFRSHTNDSLRYAQSIQAAILPSEKILQQISPNYFVLMKPCELVSGDFFWATVFEEYQVFCVADCTGHGVPGAFMSILGITALNDIVAKHRITKPSDILGYLRQSVIEALSQNDPEQLHKDGMDVALCVLNRKTAELQFAGAGLPLWIAANNQSGFTLKTRVEPFTQNGINLYEIKGDNMPVGQSPISKPFANHVISLKNQDVSVYLATDGYADQMGKSGKFGHARLKRMILKNMENPFAEQYQLVNRTFEEWKGEHYQIDDVTIIGIKL